MHKINFIFAIFLTLFTLTSQAKMLGEKSNVDTLKAQNLSANTQVKNYLVNEEPYPGGTKKEYMTYDGTVFAVTWSGRRHLDKTLVLGQYETNMNQAISSHEFYAKSSRLKKRSVKLVSDDLVYEAGGHMGALKGRAYIKSLIPSYIDLNDIK